VLVEDANAIEACVRRFLAVLIRSPKEGRDGMVFVVGNGVNAAMDRNGQRARAETRKAFIFQAGVGLIGVAKYLAGRVLVVVARSCGWRSAVGGVGVDILRSSSGLEASCD